MLAKLEILKRVLTNRIMSQLAELNKIRLSSNKVALYVKRFALLQIE